MGCPAPQAMASRPEPLGCSSFLECFEWWGQIGLWHRERVKRTSRGLRGLEPQRRASRQGQEVKARIELCAPGMVERPTPEAWDGLKDQFPAMALTPCHLKGKPCPCA